MQRQRGSLLITAAMVLSAGALGFAAGDQQGRADTQEGRAYTRDASHRLSNVVIRNGQVVAEGPNVQISNPAADRREMITELSALNAQIEDLRRRVESMGEYQRRTYVLLANRLPEPDAE